MILSNLELYIRKGVYNGLGGIYIIQSNKFRYVNQTLAKIFGYKVSEIINLKGPMDLTLPADRPLVSRNINRRINGDTDSLRYTFRGINKDKKIIHCEVLGCRFEYGGKPAVIGTLLDISERKMIQEALLESEEKYRTLVDNVNIGIYRNTGGLKGKFLFVNPAIVKIFGYNSVKELLGTNVSNLYRDPKDRNKFLKEVMRKGFIKDKELRLRKKDDTPIWGSCTARVKYDSSGKVEWLDGVVEDITERKEVEQNLQRERSEQQIILDSVPAIIFYKDTKNRFIRINKALAVATGLAKEKIEGKTCFEVYPGYAEKYWQDDKEVMESGKAKLKIIEPMETTKGKAWLQTDKIPYRDAEGNIIGIIGFSVDITERKKAEEEIRESEERYRAIFKQAPNSVVLIDAKSGELAEFNDKATENLGYSREELKKLKIQDFEVIENAEDVARHIDKISKEGSDIFETKHRRKDGKIRNILVSAKAISIHGKPFIQSIWKDITELKESQERLEAANKELSKTNRRLKQLSLKDPHTGLYNHRYLEEAVEAEFYRAKRYGHAVSVVMLDIDYFKSINDVYGHSFGDLVLKQFARLLKRMVRRYDTIIRFGGEEFIIIFSGIERASALILSERILDAISLYNFGNKKHIIKLKLSVGVASHPQDKVASGMDLVELADRILNRVKEHGGDRVYSSLNTAKKKLSDPQENIEIADVRLLRERIEKLTKREHQSLIESVFAFARTIKSRDHYTGEHTEQIVHYATEIAGLLDLPEEEVECIKQASILHDLGKVGISDKILLKHAKLSKKEFDEIKKHPQIGVDIIRPI
ncbi:MAG: PAS domain S-box protein, partial [Candidatus Omnitrophica bacterium]|nr:PAS domain S-box protein [Candidatus Omnitrophota bacterium]